MGADGTPKEKAALLAMCEEIVTAIMTAAPTNPRAAAHLVRLLRMAGLEVMPASATGEIPLEALPVSQAALRIYEYQTGPQVACLRCEHDWEQHEPSEIAAVPQDSLEEAVRAHPEYDYSCGVPGCGCRRFLTLIPDDVRELLGE